MAPGDYGLALGRGIEIKTGMSEHQQKIPRYVDVANVLEGEIGELAPNSLLSTEEQLARRFGVSRVTIRAALELLENSGLVSRLRGRGTVVSPKKVTRTFSPLRSFEQDMARQGIAFETRVLGFRRQVTPTAWVSRQLRLAEKDTVGVLSLVRVIDDRVVCHDHRVYPPDIALRIDPEQAGRQECMGMLEDVVGERVTDAHWESEILPADQTVAVALGIASRTLVFASSYTWFIESGRPVEAGTISYRVDRCKFRFAEAVRPTRRSRKT